MDPTALAIGVLGVWRVTHLLNAEDGPWRLFARGRRMVGDGFWGRLLDCFYCLSLWTSAPFALLLGGRWSERCLLWLALSAGAILLERVTSREGLVLSAPYFEEEKTDVMLRETPDRQSSRDARLPSA